MISISKAEHLPSFWHRGPGELANGLLMVGCNACFKLRNPCKFTGMFWNTILKSAFYVLPWTVHWENDLLRFSKTCELWNSKANWRLRFFAAVNHLSGPLRKQNFTSTGSKGHVWDLPLVDFDLFWVFLCFKARCLWSYLWLTAAKNVIVSWLFNFIIRVFLKSAVMVCHLL